jgi:hypothetical protein
MKHNQHYLIGYCTALSAGGAWAMSDAISKAIEKAHDDYRDTHGITGFARDALPLMAQAALQAMQGETYRFHCTNCGWKGDSLMAHKPACSALYMEHYPPQPAVPDENYKALYMELLYQVSTKHPDETSHETALRYIREAEDRTCGVSAGKGETE